MGQREGEENISTDMCVYIFCLRMLRVTSPEREEGIKYKKKVVDERQSKRR